jgi:hypothetical protein
MVLVDKLDDDELRHWYAAHEDPEDPDPEP